MWINVVHIILEGFHYYFSNIFYALLSLSSDFSMLMSQLVSHSSLKHSSFVFILLLYNANCKISIDLSSSLQIPSSASTNQCLITSVEFIILVIVLFNFRISIGSFFFFVFSIFLSIFST